MDHFSVHVVTSKYKVPISAGHFSIDVVTLKYKAPIWAGRFSIDVVASKFKAPISACHFSIHIVTSKYKALILAGHFDWRYFHQHINTKIPIFFVKIMLGVIFTKVIKPSFYSAARLSN